ncbi:MAG: heavy metal-binding domain-containing protein [bacterium]|nr:heavy metal-binding domain-containing protein [bacterium]
MLNRNISKAIFSFSILSILVSILFISSSCNKDENKDKVSETAKKDSTLRQVVYTCPMHPEVKSMNKDDKCPKCGMDLVEMKDGSMNDSQKKMHSEKYSLMLSTQPQTVKSGEEVTLNFSLMNNETKQTIKDLEIVHEKLLHLIIVTKNLAYFDHIHPEMNSNGSLTVKTKFDKGGDYILFADLKPKGEKESQVFDIPLKVTGEPVANIPITTRNTFETEGFTAVLTTDPADLAADKSTEVVVKLTKNGKEVTDLRNYLGALGHMVVISEDASMYLHVHPMEAEEKNDGHNHDGKKEMDGMEMDSDKVTKSGPGVVFHTNFPKSGLYKVFAQFNPGGKLITTNFVVNVK